MNFVALDFETANEHRGSVCAVGIVKVRGGQVIDRLYWLVRPKTLDFNPYNTSIHGITADDVRDKPRFCDLWDELRGHLNSEMVIAHNAGFDMSVLRYVVADYSLPEAEFPYSCTRLIGRMAWPGLISYALTTVADSLGIVFKHHDAVEDARASAEIAVRACVDAGAKTIEELAECLKFKNGRMYPGGYTPPRSPSLSSGFKISDLKPSDNADSNAPLAGRVFVFTGTLHSMPRIKAMQCVVDAGGGCGNGVTKDTNYLVMGDQDFARLRDGEKSSKLVKAEGLICKGADLELLSEDEFLRMLPA